MTPRLEKLIARFGAADRQVRLEALLDASRTLPPLPERYAEARAAGLNRVPECQTPVFLWIEEDAGGLHLHADVPRESPTVRGFVGLLVRSLDGATRAQVAAVPDDLIERLGLGDALGMQRMHGLAAVLLRIKRHVAALPPAAAGAPTPR